MTEIFVFFAIVVLLLGAIAALCFKIASLYKRLSALNFLINDMLWAGVSEKAANLATNYYRKER